MTAPKVRRAPEGVTISWGWLGRTLAGVVIAGVPTLVGIAWQGVGRIRASIAEAQTELRAMHEDLTILKGQQSSLLADMYDVRQWMQRHAEQEAAAEADIREKLGAVQARRNR